MKLKYIQIPIELFKGLFDDKDKCLRKIFFVGVYQIALKISFTNQDVARQVLYIVYRERCFSLLKQTINKLPFKYVGESTDYFFSKGMYENDFFTEEIDELINLIDKNPEFRELCFNTVRVREVLKSFEIDYDVEALIAIAQPIQRTLPQGIPTVGINMGLLLEFINKSKSLSDLIEFSAFHAIKSILGTKQMMKTNMNLIVARMFGFARFADLDDSTTSHPVFLKLNNNRYQRGKLFDNLELNWFVKKLGKNIRGFMIAIGNDISYSEMGDVLNKTQLKRRLAALKAEKRFALQKKQPGVIRLTPHSAAKQHLK